MQVKYPHDNQLRLLFTDTDSLAYAVQTEEISRWEVLVLAHFSVVLRVGRF